MYTVVQKLMLSYFILLVLIGFEVHPKAAIDSRSKRVSKATCVSSKVGLCGTLEPPVGGQRYYNQQRSEHFTLTLYFISNINTLVENCVKTIFYELCSNGKSIFDNFICDNVTDHEVF